MACGKSEWRHANIRSRLLLAPIYTNHFSCQPHHAFTVPIDSRIGNYLICWMSSLTAMSTRVADKSILFDQAMDHIDQGGSNFAKLLATVHFSVYLTSLHQPSAPSVVELLHQYLLLRGLNARGWSIARISSSNITFMLEMEASLEQVQTLLGSVC
ncbi:hypothetical protein Leryth_027396 [Lithospermum erythrorhizon]|nr:hypothetical protein Leryth_027396 [Lithospermum erythrorhizon]